MSFAFAASPSFACLHFATRRFLVRPSVHLLGLASALCVVAPGSGAQLPREALQELRQEIAQGDVGGSAHQDLPRYRDALLHLYTDSTSNPLWLRNGAPTPQASALLHELGAASERGLLPGDYDASALVSEVRRARPDTEASAIETTLRRDVWLTLSATRFVDQVRHGRVDPRSMGFSFARGSDKRDLAQLVSALRTSTDVHATIDSIEPPYPGYRALEMLLGHYRSLMSDSALTTLPAIDSSLRAGDSWKGAPALRRLLAALGELPSSRSAIPDADSDAYDDDLVAAVSHYQEHHGLTADGVLGRATLAQLRTPIASRVLQIELTMERWRWLPEPVEGRLIVVNIPEFRLRALAHGPDGETVGAEMDVIVGSAFNKRRTPIFASEMRDVVFHPYWDVPRTIARREEIPKMRRDPSYATRQGMEIVRGGDIGARQYPLTAENFQKVIAGTLRLRQRPGPRNALGRVKFVFPNAHDVYLHDTPEQSLFAQSRRDFSHGCIRASDPEAVAEFVLRGQPGWTRERIEASMAEDGPPTTVALSQPIPVFIVYATVVATHDGASLFLPDIYSHDAALARAFRERAAQPSVSSAELRIPEAPE